MDWVKNIRLTIGLSQKQLGDFLSITRSFVAHIEAGRRNLSLVATQKLIFFYQIITDHNITTDFLSEPEIPLQDYSKIIRTETIREQMCTLLAEQLRRKQDMLVARYRECLRTYPVMKLVDQNLPDDKEKAKNKLWVQIWQDDTDEKMKSCGVIEQYNLQRRIAALLCDAEQARIFIASLPV